MNLKVKFKVKEGTSNQVPNHKVMLDNILEAVPTISYGNMAHLKDGLLLFLTDREQIVKLMSDNVKDILDSKDITVLPPQWLYPSITIFARKIYSSITNHSTEEILSELTKANPDFDIKSVVVMPNSYNDGRDLRTLKLTFNSPAKATDAFENGFTIFGLTVHSNQLLRHREYNAHKIVQCHKCFQFNHYTNACSLPDSDAKCSCCGLKHNFRVCPNKENPKCVNCGNNHHSVSNKCELRIKAMTDNDHKANSEHIETPAPTPQPPQLSPREFPPLPSKVKLDEANSTPKIPLDIPSKSDNFGAHAPAILSLSKLCLIGEIEEARQLYSILNSMYQQNGYKTLTVNFLEPQKRKANHQYRMPVPSEEEKHEQEMEEIIVNAEDIDESQFVLGEAPPDPSPIPKMRPPTPQPLSTSNPSGKKAPQPILKAAKLLFKPSSPASTVEENKLPLTQDSYIPPNQEGPHMAEFNIANSSIENHIDPLINPSPSSNQSLTQNSNSASQDSYIPPNQQGTHLTQPTSPTPLDNQASNPNAYSLPPPLKSAPVHTPPSGGNRFRLKESDLLSLYPLHAEAIKEARKKRCSAKKDKDKRSPHNLRKCKKKTKHTPSPLSKSTTDV